jgi:SAM-dependent methyltransferase
MKPEQRYMLRQIVKAVPPLRLAALAAEGGVKRTLAAVLWMVWRSGLNPRGYLRGTTRTSGRYYIRQFLRCYQADCHGAFLEFGDPYFRDCFTSSQITHYDIMDVVPRSDVTIQADIQDCPQIASHTYDVIVCTQVLEHIANPFKAASELHRILKPGGKLLLTVPAAYEYHADPHDYWRYTPDSLRLLFDPLFTEVTLHTYGNPLIVVAAYWYWMADHLPTAALELHDPRAPTILCLYAVK